MKKNILAFTLVPIFITFASVNISAVEVSNNQITSYAYPTDEGASVRGFGSKCLRVPWKFFPLCRVK